MTLDAKKISEENLVIFYDNNFVFVEGDYGSFDISIVHLPDLIKGLQYVQDKYGIKPSTEG